MTKKKRIYRKRGSKELNDPGKNPRDEVNRLTIIFSARIDKKLVKRANRHINQLKKLLKIETKAEWVTNAIKKAIEEDLNK